MKNGFEKFIKTVTSVNMIVTAVMAVMVFFLQRDIGNREIKLEKMSTAIDSIGLDLQKNSNKMQKVNNILFEGELVLGLMPSLLNGSTNEKKLSLLILNRCCREAISDTIIRIVSKHTTDNNVRRLAQDVVKQGKIAHLANSAVKLSSVGLYQQASKRYKEAASLLSLETIEQRKMLRQAVERHQTGEYQEAITCFQKACPKFRRGVNNE